MRRLFSVLLMVFLLLLHGCGKTEETPQYNLNPDGTIGDLRWGMTFTQAARAEKGIAHIYPGAAFLGSQPTDKSTLRIRLPDGEFLGTNIPVIVELYFQRISKERNQTPPLRLTEIRIFIVSITEKVDLTDWAGACLTRMEPVTEPAAISAWASAETLGDRVPRDILQEAFRYNTEAYIDSLCGKALYTASTDTATRLFTGGYYQALAAALGY